MCDEMQQRPLSTTLKMDAKDAHVLLHCLCFLCQCNQVHAIERLLLAHEAEERAELPCAPQTIRIRRPANYQLGQVVDEGYTVLGSSAFGAVTIFRQLMTLIGSTLSPSAMF